MITMKKDIEIAQEKAKDMKNIREIAAKVGLEEDDLEQYGKYQYLLYAAQAQTAAHTTYYPP